MPADLFAGVNYFINDDVDQATQEDVSHHSDSHDKKAEHHPGKY